MSELSNTVETRLHAAELAVAAATVAAANAQGTASSADTKADAANRHFSIDATPPDSPAFGQLWSDTSVTGTLQLKMFDGVNWVQINPV